ncbi:caspase family protein [Pseudohoeflea suaedae]|uniref:Caspase family protein n=1 Tax=Pseudohoeflea suaedae TaxID=877384 RepID=A0A4R5PQP4_9HYPH|nr:caspase family protein [Pseudohoeflea suaedae]TDH38957.1 caspase family protein [Pseudohoeflea suaedae]
MSETLKIMCVHGLGDQRRSGWEAKWKDAIETVIGADAGVTPEFRFVNYDDIFADTDISFFETMEAFWKLAGSGLGARRRRGLISKISDRLRWTAGYVVAWVADDGFQEETRKLILDEIRDFAPDVVLAHSLGSLITYNAFSHKDAGEKKAASALKNAHYVTFGSQIGNPFVLGNLTHGRVAKLDVRHWHHLFNEHDDIFTAPLVVPGAVNFSQHLTSFDLAGFGDHDAVSYIGHNVTRSSFWAPLIDGIAQAAQSGRSRGRARGIADPWSRAVNAKDRPERKRALLIGIDDYPNDSQKLEGCVNDVYSMSATLQDCGFEPEEIRICLNDRATTEGILSRFEWLVEDARGGDKLVFYYSGHGARVPEYGAREEPDHMTEILVPHDCDFSPERSISDEQIFELYSQLPYDTQMLMFFDCCHSGSMHRQGVNKARGAAPPDDIRHRALKWNSKVQMWEERSFTELNRSFSSRKTDRAKFFGDNRSTVRIGRAPMLRQAKETDYKKAKAESDGPVGPYLPLIIEACDEQEFSWEYRHGATSYGAFTFCLTSILREEKNITYEELVSLAARRLKELGYEQTPKILGPSTHLTAKIPFKTGQASRRRVTDLPGSSTPRTSG